VREGGNLARKLIKVFYYYKIFCSEVLSMKFRDHACGQTPLFLNAY
jgi:hypothetical protein